MRLFRILATLILLTTLHSQADLIPDAAAKSVGAVDLDTYRLYQRLVGSSWSYLWRGKTGQLTFAQGGAVNTPMWAGATWRITGPNTIAIKSPENGEMPVHFNGEFKKFTAKDWSGGEGVGTLHDPNAKVKR